MTLESIDLLIEESAREQQGDVLAALFDVLFTPPPEKEPLCTYVSTTIRKVVLRRLLHKVTRKIDQSPCDILLTQQALIYNQLRVVEDQCHKMRVHFPPSLLKEKHAQVEREYRYYINRLSIL